MYSGGVDVDILAGGAGKGKALEFLMQRLKAEGHAPAQGVQVRPACLCAGARAHVRRGVALWARLWAYVRSCQGLRVCVWGGGMLEAGAPPPSAWRLRGLPAWLAAAAAAV